MVIADVTFSEPPKVPGIFCAVVSSESSFALAHLQYPVDGAKDSDGQTLHRLARGVPSIDGAPPSKSSVEYRQELIEKYRSALSSLSNDKSENPYAVKVDKVLWLTRFRTCYCAAQTLFTDYGS
jgi:hypothetical protein